MLQDQSVPSADGQRAKESDSLQDTGDPDELLWEEASDPYVGITEHGCDDKNKHAGKELATRRRMAFSLTHKSTMVLVLRPTVLLPP